MNVFESSIEEFTAWNRKLLEGVLRPFDQGAGGMDSSAVLQLLAEDFVRNPARWQSMQENFYRRHAELWARVTSSPSGASSKPEMHDRRFRGEAWREPYFDTLVQSYLTTATCLTEAVNGAALEPQVQRKLAFYVRQYVDAMSPANFAWTNPEALKLAADTQGASLAQGMKNLSADADKGMVSMTDESAFEVGRNLAITPGAVVFENELMQLLQYYPSTEKVFTTPMLMVPPCINKFYILDLQPENSLVRYAVEQGHTVFMVSWRNVPENMGGTTWDDYLQKGIIKAIEVVRSVCRVRKINALGFCVGGTLIASALAVLRAKGKNPVASLTLLATMLDFSDTGELSVFIDDAYVQKREREFSQSANGGILQGRELAITFASLRANDLIWNYVVNNYLKGRTPEPFDLLYWNSDSTNLPGAMYAYYIRNTYLENSLRTPGKLIMCGTPVDLGEIDMPTYLLATREDHIVPWKTAYASTQLLVGDLTFVLSASGHIAGVINPAARDRRNYWSGETLVESPDEWFASATARPGSWWKHWSAWQAKHSGRRIAARAKIGSAKYAQIEAAPGHYVREKLA
jgi:polyhydroxyalkanoate synthase subunit PhaC